MAFTLPPGSRLFNPVFESIKTKLWGSQEFAATSGTLPRLLAFFGQSNVSTIYREGDDNPWGRFVPEAQAAFYTPIGPISQLFSGESRSFAGSTQQQPTLTPQPSFDLQPSINSWF